MAGRFIVFEGLDGAGTTTQAELLRAHLTDRGIPVKITREPTGGAIGAVARSVVEGRTTLPPAALALAFAADRLDHLEKPDDGVLARLAAGTWVVSDRYVLSSLAYQGVATGDPEWIAAINRRAVPPDLTVFLETPTDACLQRIAGRSSRTDLYEDRTTLERVAEAFRTARERRGLTGELLVVAGDRPREEIAADVRRAVGALLAPDG